MKLDIVFNRSEDNNGYAEFRVAAYKKPTNINIFLRGISIREWSKGSGGNLNHYLKKDKPAGKSVWVHSASIEVFDSYDDCKKNLIEIMTDELAQFIKN